MGCSSGNEELNTKPSNQPIIPNPNPNTNIRNIIPINSDINSNININKPNNPLIDKFKMGLCKVSYKTKEKYSMQTIGILCKIPFPDNNRLLHV